MPKMEPYKVVVPPPEPKPMQLLASDFPVGTIVIKDDLLFVQELQQRVFVEDMITGVKAYASDLGSDIAYVIWDRDYERFEFKLVKRLVTP